MLSDSFRIYEHLNCCNVGLALQTSYLILLILEMVQSSNSSGETWHIFPPLVICRRTTPSATIAIASGIIRGMPAQHKEARTQELCTAGMRLSTPSIDRSYFEIIPNSQLCSAHWSCARKNYWRNLWVHMSIMLFSPPCQHLLNPVYCVLP